MSRSRFFAGDIRRRESAYFYTFHKCASTLFSSLLLPSVIGRRHRDYASLIFTGNLSREIAFEERGWVYGPVRLSAVKGGDVYERLVIPTTRPDFVRDKICLFLVRDPRDILVSLYYSAGFTHSLSPVDEIREEQVAKREAIREITLDEYVVRHAAERRAEFAWLHDLHSICRRGVLLRYEDMVYDFEGFAHGLCTYLEFPKRVLRSAERQSRPRTEVDNSQQRRSGRPGQFRDVLRKETIDSLNDQLHDTLQLFGYRP